MRNGPGPWQEGPVGRTRRGKISRSDCRARARAGTNRERPGASNPHHRPPPHCSSERRALHVAGPPAGA
eukprot:7146661-Pyramimonas_sp.AAC.1